MKVLWIAPLHRRCGIAIYAERYCTALREHMDVEVIDPASLDDTAQLARCVQACDVVHVQYEPSLLLDGHQDRYSLLLRTMTRPLVVSLHEVYRDFPGVYPRDRIAGKGLLRKLKLLRYDRRHPHLTMFRRHCSTRFNASRILVHYPFQRDILVEKDVPPGQIAVLDHPVPDWNPPAGVGKQRGKSPIRIGAAGFIHANYDYALLFRTLERIDQPWTFHWIGGIRRTEDERIRTWLLDQVRSRGWQERFTVSGWVSDEEMRTSLWGLDVYLALFSARSSSGTLTAALGARRTVVASDLPLVHAINREEQVVGVVPAHPGQIADAIKELSLSTSLRARYKRNVGRYVHAHSYAASARQLCAVYNEVCCG